jgi:hypothetical protein
VADSRQSAVRITLIRLGLAKARKEAGIEGVTARYITQIAVATARFQSPQTKHEFETFYTCIVLVRGSPTHTR